MIKIAFLVPEEYLIELVRSIYDDHSRHNPAGDGADYDFSVSVAKNYRAIPRAALEADVIVARGLITAELKRIHPDTALVEVPIGVEMTATLFRALRERGNLPIAVIGSFNMIYAARGIGEVLDADIKLYQQHSNEDFVIERDVDHILADGRKIIICGPVTYKHASQRDCFPYVLGMSNASIWEALSRAKREAVLRRRDRERSMQFQAVLNSAHEGIIAADREGRVTLFNATAADILQVQPDRIAGGLVYDILPMDKLTESFRAADDAEDIVPFKGEHLSINKAGVRLGGELSSHVITLQKSSAILKAESKIRQELYAKGHVAKYAFSDILGSSPRLAEAVETARNFASVASNILIIGDTGTGKEMFAQSIHNESSRRRAPFVAINCAALSKSLLESELFGYAEGAFTGAARGGKPGIFETAHTGTIFLDEISEIPLDLQGRLLRVLQERQIMRLGDDRIVPIDVRIISATNKRLLDEVQSGTFRRDLYYRLNVLSLFLPTLNDRGADILTLAAFFIDECCRRFGKKTVALSDGACARLLSRRWDGNIRELRNACERLVVLNKTGVVGDADVDRIVGVGVPAAPSPRTRKRAADLDDFHRERIRKALADCPGDRAAAAALLGISKVTLWRRMRRLGMDGTEGERSETK